ncbi:hypothetical protein CW304_06545 [Bacillus sp. UFRGS-B20]|nr:hypothetical protein CW304_06545 [Bacillus sp. UFRGS-B20]
MTRNFWSKVILLCVWPILLYASPEHIQDEAPLCCEYYPCTIRKRNDSKAKSRSYACRKRSKLTSL